MISSDGVSGLIFFWSILIVLPLGLLAYTIFRYYRRSSFLFTPQIGKLQLEATLPGHWEPDSHTIGDGWPVPVAVIMQLLVVSLVIAALAADDYATSSTTAVIVDVSLDTSVYSQLTFGMTNVEIQVQTASPSDVPYRAGDSATWSYDCSDNPTRAHLFDDAKQCFAVAASAGLVLAYCIMTIASGVFMLHTMLPCCRSLNETKHGSVLWGTITCQTVLLASILLVWGVVACYANDMSVSLSFWLLVGGGLANLIGVHSVRRLLENSLPPNDRVAANQVAVTPVRTQSFSLQNSQKMVQLMQMPSPSVGHKELDHNKPTAAAAANAAAPNNDLARETDGSWQIAAATPTGVAAGLGPAVETAAGVRYSVGAHE